MSRNKAGRAGRIIRYVPLLLVQHRETWKFRLAPDRGPFMEASLRRIAAKENEMSRAPAVLAAMKMTRDIEGSAGPRYAKFR